MTTARPAIPTAMHAAKGAVAALLASLCLWAYPPAVASASDTASVSVSIRIEPYAFVEFPDGFDFLLKVRRHGHGGHHHSGHDGNHHDDHGHHDDDDDDRRGGKQGKRGKGDKHGDRNEDHGHRHGGHDRGRGHDDHGNGHGYGHGHVWYSVEPVLIPFKIRGNATASVSARPIAFMPVHDAPWSYLGESEFDSHDGGHGHGGGHRHPGQGHDRGHGPRLSHYDTLGYNVIMQFPISSWHHASVEGWQSHGGGFWDRFASLPGTDGEGTPPLLADVSGSEHGVFGMIYVVSKADWTRDGMHAKPGSYRGEMEVFVTASE